MSYPRDHREGYVYILLARDKGDSVEFRGPVEIEREHLVVAAEVALREGYTLMFEFTAEPTQEQLEEHVKRGLPISDMEAMARLWVLEVKDG